MLAGLSEENEVKRLGKSPGRVPASRSHDTATIESFRRNPKYAAEYLDAVLADGDQKELLTAIRYMAKAFGGVREMASVARLNSTTLYRTLSPKGNPELRSFRAVLRVMGLRLSVRPVASGAR